MTAEQIVPNLAHVTIVGDRFEMRPSFRRFAEELPALAQRTDVIDLTGLPLAELRTRVASPPDHTAILYTAIHSDGRGTYFVPAEALAKFADVAAAPIVAFVES